MARNQDFLKAVAAAILCGASLAGASVKAQEPAAVPLLAWLPKAPSATTNAPNVGRIDTSRREPLDPSSPQMQALDQKIRRVLRFYYPKHQNTRDNTTWEVMHEIIAFGVDAQLRRGSPDGPKVNAIGWLCYNGPCQGEQLLYLDRGRLVARKGVGLQGHFGQFLAILAQSHLKLDYPMVVGGKQFTIRDLVEHEKEDCQAGEELTFKLIGLMHYLDSDDTWRSRDGQEWSIQRLVAEELKQPIRGAACGGTHRLMGFSYAVNKRIKRGKPITGEFQRAQTFINDFHRYTFGLQNQDGSFSTQWFTRREADPDVDRRLKTTGHIAEWLSFSLSDEEIRDPRMVKAIDYLATILLQGQDRTWEIGPLGHGLHALAMYDQRMFPDSPSAPLPSGDPTDASGDEAPGPMAQGRRGRLSVVSHPAVTRHEETAADRPSLLLEMSPCDISRDNERQALLPPDAHLAPGDENEGCL